jgi:hypothetical protein
MFACDHAITERFPTIRAEVAYATGLANGPGHPELLEECRAGELDRDSGSSFDRARRCVSSELGTLPPRRLTHLYQIQKI